MEVKKDILWRVYMSFIGIMLLGLLILGKAVYIQQAQGDKWLAMAKAQEQKFFDIQAERGSIYSDDGSMLSISVPYFDIYVDFKADGLRADKGKLFRENLDSLSYFLSKFFRDKPASLYKKELQLGYRLKDRYFLLRKNLSYNEYKQVKKFPLLRLDPNKGGMILNMESKRLAPYGLMANRTIGLAREYQDADGSIHHSNVGLELSYDSILKGEGGKRLMQRISPGVYIPVEGTQVEPRQGRDIQTTLNVNIQDIAQNALQKMMVANSCVSGTCIVMEVATGQIKAMANLGKNADCSYSERMNYAIEAKEPGSTFKLATMIALLEDGLANNNSLVDLENGKWEVNGKWVYDSEIHTVRMTTLREAFKRSSNVGMAKMIMKHYEAEPTRFIDHLKKLHLHQRTGIDLKGEAGPVLRNPEDKRNWSRLSLPWLSFGYGVNVSPLQTLTLYNAIANNGVMVKPYLVSSIQENGLEIERFSPSIVEDRIVSTATLNALKSCLVGVCHEDGGTAYSLFKDCPYKVAGKTGTSLVAKPHRGYKDNIHQSSFAGFFPADHPKYSCIVVIENYPGAKNYYGGKIAAPVFKEVADKLYALEINENNYHRQANRTDSATYFFAGEMKAIKEVFKSLGWKYRDSAADSEWGQVYAKQGQPVVAGQTLVKKLLPEMKGMGMKDAVFLLEKMGLEVTVRGRGRLVYQSLPPGSAVRKKEKIQLEFN